MLKNYNSHFLHFLTLTPLKKAKYAVIFLYYLLPLSRGKNSMIATFNRKGYLN